MAIESVEILIAKEPSIAGEKILSAMSVAMKAAGSTVQVTNRYRGESDVLMLFGVGSVENNSARNLHRAAGKHVVMWDLGYFGNRKHNVRVSIDDDHPTRFMDMVPSSGRSFNLTLRDVSDPDGPILLIGTGAKTRRYTRDSNWEINSFVSLSKRFPGRKIIYRPKSARDSVKIPCERAWGLPIQDALTGVSLLVCRHSNAAADAIVAGVPFEAIDGAAMWLSSKPYTRDNRGDFLNRLAWFQWAPEEAAVAWQFLSGIIEQ